MDTQLVKTPTETAPAALPVVPGESSDGPQPKVWEGPVGKALPLKLTGGKPPGEYGRFRLSQLHELGVVDTTSLRHTGNILGSICDFPLGVIRKSESSLKQLANAFQKLMRNLAVPLEKRAEAIESFTETGKDLKAIGFYFVDPASMLRKRFKDGGAAIIGIMDKLHRMRGAITLDIDPSTLFADDRDLVEKFKKSKHYEEGKVYTVLYAAGIDPAVEDPIEDNGKKGGFGIDRFQMYKVLHALAILKLRSAPTHIDYALSCVREFPCGNPASKAHAALGYKHLPGLRQIFPNFIPTLGQTPMVEHHLLQLDIWSDQQTQIISEVQDWLKAHPELPFRVFDKTNE